MMTNDQIKSGGELNVAGAFVRHLKRGTEYEVVATGTLQCAANAALDEQPVVVYRGEDGRYWVRGVTEFNDGRFEEVSCTPSHGRVSGEERLRQALQEIYDLPGELNLSNYDNSDVELLNSNFVEAIMIAERALSTPPETVTAPIPVEGEVIQADIDRAYAALDRFETIRAPTLVGDELRDAIAVEMAADFATHRLTFSRGVDKEAAHAAFVLAAAKIERGTRLDSLTDDEEKSLVNAILSALHGDQEG